MGRPPNPLPRDRRAATPPSSEDVLKALTQILEPLVRLLLSCGIDFTRLTDEIKWIFVEQARIELLRTAQRDSDSAISLLSGVHRKDVRHWRQFGMRPRSANEVPLTAQVFAIWLHEPAYLDQERHPLALKRIGPTPSFESLVRTVTKDIHPFTVLGQLLRLGLVDVEQRDDVEVVVPHREGFIPAPGSREHCALFAANLSDHASAAVGNLLGQSPRLEQSVFADGLTQKSVHELSLFARKLWEKARREMLIEASRLVDADRGCEDATYRMRFGSYFWDEIVPDDAKDIAHSPDKTNDGAEFEHRITVRTLGQGQGETSEAE